MIPTLFKNPKSYLRFGQPLNCEFLENKKQVTNFQHKMARVNIATPKGRSRGTTGIITAKARLKPNRGKNNPAAPCLKGGSIFGL